MADSNLTFAKITASPTQQGWSQVYSAGKLFAALSLEKEQAEEEKDYLNILGKEILDILEQEFFTLETKDLDSIRQAVMATSAKIPDNVTLSFVIGVAVENVLYLYILGSGKVDLKRGSSIGSLLSVKDGGTKDLKEASGYLQDKDVIILQTDKFSNTISEATLSEFLDGHNFSETAENLAPLVLEKEEPAASCLLVEYREEVKKDNFETVTESPEQEVEQKIPEPEKEPAVEEYFNKTSRIGLSKNLLKANFSKFSNLNHSRKLILTIAVIIVIVFVLSVFFALQKQKSEKLISDFNSVYPVASKKYEEGQSLVSLNQSLARDSFTQAKDILENGKNKFPTNSTQEKQILDLLSKVNNALGSSAPSKTVTATAVSNDESFYLSFEIKQKAQDFAKDTKSVYFITQNGISSAVNGSSDIKTLFVNKTDWKSIGGFATYNTNVYALDKSQNQILKFVNTGSAYEKTNYFATSVTPDFSKAVSMTIDNNIYVLFNDGAVAKYFKGQAQDFEFKGLDKNLLNPTKIYSNPDLDNIYVLDNGNSRIVVFDKSGSYKAQYTSALIKGAKDFEILEKDKKIYILSADKIYKINL